VLSDPDPLALLKGPTSKEKEGKARGEEGKVKRREGERSWRKGLGPPKNLGAQWRPDD